MKLHLFTIFLIVTEPLLFSQWAIDLEDYGYLFSQQTISKREIKTCTVRLVSLDYKWFEKDRTYYRNISEDQIFEFDEKGRVIIYRYEYDSYDYQYYEMVYSYDSLDLLTKLTNTYTWRGSGTTNEIFSRTFFYTKDGRIKSEILEEGTGKQIITNYFYEGNLLAGDSSSSTCYGVEWNDVAHYQWRKDGTYSSRKLEFRDKCPDDFHLLRDHPSGKVRARFDLYKVVYYLYAENNLIEEIKIGYYERYHYNEYGNCLEKPDKNYRIEDKSFLYQFTYADGLPVEMKIIYKKKKVLAEFEFIYSP